MKPETTERRYLTPEELCQRWNNRIKMRTLHNWRQTGNGPPYTKIGGAVLYPIDKLQAWEDGNTVHSTSEYGRKTKSA